MWCWFLQGLTQPMATHPLWEATKFQPNVSTFILCPLGNGRADCRSIDLCKTSSVLIAGHGYWQQGQCAHRSETTTAQVIFRSAHWVFPSGSWSNSLWLSAKVFSSTCHQRPSVYKACVMASPLNAVSDCQVDQPCGTFLVRPI